MININTLYNKAYEYCVTAETTNNIPKYVKKQCKILKSIMDNENNTYFVSDNICDKINKLLSLLVMPTGFKSGGRLLLILSYLINACFLLVVFALFTAMNLQKEKT